MPTPDWSRFGRSTAVPILLLVGLLAILGHLHIDLAHGYTAPRVVAGWSKELRFSGARIGVSVAEDDPGLEPGKRVRCLLRLPGEEEPVVASALIRRVTLSLADRNEWQRDVGLEFQVTGSEDRDAVARICEFVLALERFQLSRRVSLSGARPW